MAGLVLGVAAALLGAPAAGAAKAPQTLRGSHQQNGIGDDPDPATLTISATFTKAGAEGSIRTVQGGGHEDWESFQGEVTCVRQTGRRFVIGAFGHAYNERVVFDEQSEEQVLTSEELPGTYMQVVVYEIGNFEDMYGNGTFHRHAWNYLGGSGAGEPSPVAPSCTGHSSLKGFWVGELGEIGLSPTITVPRAGKKVKSSRVTLKGTGEPESELKVFEPSHPDAAITVLVGRNGSWSLVWEGLAPGRHELLAQPQQEAGVTEPARVSFEVA